MKINDVPLSLHEEMIKRHYPLDPQTGRPLRDPVLEGLATAMHAGREAAEKARAITIAVMRNENLTVPARHRKVQDETRKLMLAAAPRLDRSRQAAAAEIELLRESSAAPPAPRDPHGTAVAGEVRNRLAAMDPGKRRAFLAEAIRQGDDTILAAVLNAPPILSGMTDRTELDDWRETWRRARHPEAVERIGRLEKAIADCEQGGGLMVGFFSSLADPEIVSKAMALENEAARAIAAAHGEETTP